MRTLSAELAPHAARLSLRPRIYADANVPAGLVSFMRGRLHWDVLFVLEETDLRRATDTSHYRLARQLGRTLITLDRDYLDNRRFPPDESSGVLVISAPGERELSALLGRVDRAFFRRPAIVPDLNTDALPLVGRKLYVTADWGRERTAASRRPRSHARARTK